MSLSAQPLPSGDVLTSGLRLRVPGKADAIPPVLIAENVTKRFGSQTVLDSVSLRLEPGTVHALLGENGAGKSTLVKCIMGFYHADGGRVVVGDSAVHIKNPKDAQLHGIGMVYQHFTLVENMTVAENLVLARACSGVDRLEERTRSARCVHGQDAIFDLAQALGSSAGGGRKAEARDPQTIVSRQSHRNLG